MSRSGYTDNCDDPLAIGRWRGQVKSSIRGKRGQAFLRELAMLMDRMPKKILIEGELIDDDGDCCAIGVVCKERGIDVSKVDPQDIDEVGNAVGISCQMAAEIEYQNDEGQWEFETCEERWIRMRGWVEKQIRRT